MLSALSSIDQSLSFEERRARYAIDKTSQRVVFGLGMNFVFDVRERLETDIAMARWFGPGVMLGPDGKFDKKVLDELKLAQYDVNDIVCVGDDVSSWVVVGKHFALEMRNAKFG